MHARGSLVSHFQVQRSRAFGSCHAMATDVKEALAAPLQDLPAVDFAFAYGSGVFQQPGNLILSRNEAPMVDYILGVQMPTRWHSEVSYVAEKVGAGVHFNAFVPWKDKMIKYGVIGMGDLAEDLLTWKSLYISGRLQKPVRFLVDNWDMAKVNQVNLHAAASTALLLLPSQFSEEDFYAKICGLSYMGDIRMLFAEDKNKVQRIVKGSSKHFHRLYRAPLFHMAAEGILELPRTFGDVRSLIKRPLCYQITCTISSRDYSAENVPICKDKTQFRITSFFRRGLRTCAEGHTQHSSLFQHKANAFRPFGSWSFEFLAVRMEKDNEGVTVKSTKEV
ncbi:hypothetical protein KP509_30G041300 [Ceratopteris richardii]|uniref:Phosphatidate cytidylyltransferase, mitochondrial n=1 Tax=Ceratopteris richardii TaxID=49495 RepID=A0A8T2R3C6_CERRI|nr:hypothetical protein KP509_30G041300 [Ceratopteris richardii]